MAYTYKYPRPAVTADSIVITREAEPKVLLIQRGNPPFKGAWATNHDAVCIFSGVHPLISLAFSGLN
jgi:hypothetical protein